MTRKIFTLFVLATVFLPQAKADLCVKISGNKEVYLVKPAENKRFLIPNSTKVLNKTCGGSITEYSADSVKAKLMAAIPVGDPADQTSSASPSSLPDKVKWIQIAATDPKFPDYHVGAELNSGHSTSPTADPYIVEFEDTKSVKCAAWTLKVCEKANEVLASDGTKCPFDGARYSIDYQEMPCKSRETSTVVRLGAFYPYGTTVDFAKKVNYLIPAGERDAGRCATWTTKSCNEDPLRVGSVGVPWLVSGNRVCRLNLTYTTDLVVKACPSASSAPSSAPASDASSVSVEPRKVTWGFRKYLPDSRPGEGLGHEKSPAEGSSLPLMIDITNKKCAKWTIRDCKKDDPKTIYLTVEGVKRTWDQACKSNPEPQLYYSTDYEEVPCAPAETKQVKWGPQAGFPHGTTLVTAKDYSLGKGQCASWKTETCEGAYQYLLGTGVDGSKKYCAKDQRYSLDYQTYGCSTGSPDQAVASDQRGKCNIDGRFQMSGSIVTKEYCFNHCRATGGQNCSYTSPIDDSVVIETKEMRQTRCAVSPSISMTYLPVTLLAGDTMLAAAEETKCQNAVQAALKAVRDPASDGKFEVTFTGAPRVPSSSVTYYKATIQAKRTPEDAADQLESVVQGLSNFQSACTSRAYGDYAVVKVVDRGGISGCQKDPKKIKKLCQLKALQDGSLITQELNDPTVLKASSSCYSFCKNFIENHKGAFFNIEDATLCGPARKKTYRCSYESPSEDGNNDIEILNYCFEMK